MAHVHETSVTIKVSKLVKDHGNEPCEGLVSEELTTALETVVSELLNDPSCVVEVSTDSE